MQLCKVITNEPIKNYICVYGEENDIKHARVVQKSIHRAKYCQLTKEEIKDVLEKPCYTYVKRLNHSCWVIEREKQWNLATIYYREVNGEKEVFDIHYHKNGNINGHRTEDEVIKDTNSILEECGFNIKLFIGGFICQKKQVNRKTNRHTEKQYKKIKLHSQSAMSKELKEM